jgi:DNA-binding response OmpR family regulator
MPKIYSAKVIIIEDNPQQLELYRVMLALAAGIPAETCVTGNAGLDRIMREPKPDIVLLDMHLPGILGMEIFRVIWECLPDTAIFVVTGDPSLAYTYQPLADHTFIKPVVPVAEVLAAVDTACIRMEQRRQKEN